MDIIPVLNRFISDIFEAAGDFQEDLSRLDLLEARLKESANSFLAGILGQILEDTDEFLRNAPGRDKLYTIQRTRERTLVSSVGDILFSRTQFQSMKDGTYHFLLDERIGLPKDEHFTEVAEAQILQDAAEGSYRAAAERISSGSQTVSKTAVMNKIHRIVEELPLDAPAEKKHCKYLYVEADEDHIHRQEAGKEAKDGCILGKLVYVFEGREAVRKGRNALINPVYFGGSYAGAEGNSQLWDRVQEYILKNYDQRSLKCIYISGDGASWIKAGTEHIAKSVFVADRFHLMKYINAAARQMLDECDEVKGKIYKNIWKDRLKKIQKLFKKMRKSASSLKPIDECETFLTNNWDAIQRAFHAPGVIGCSAEGHVSHLYSDRMSSRPMAWSETGADRMCRLRCFVRTNGKGKVIDLVKARRMEAMRPLAATGTDGVEISLSAVRKRYTKAQLETAAYAEALHAELSSTLTRKHISIALHKALY